MSNMPADDVRRAIHVSVCVQQVVAGHLCHKALVIDGRLGVVAGTKHMLGRSRITDDQEAAGRTCMHTALPTLKARNTHTG